MNLKNWLKPAKSKIIATFILLLIFEVLIFAASFNVMVSCLCPPPPAECNCNPSYSERMEFGIRSVAGISTNPIIIPIIIILYIISCLFVTAYRKFKI